MPAVVFIPRLNWSFDQDGRMLGGQVGLELLTRGWGPSFTEAQAVKHHVNRLPVGIYDHGLEDYILVV